MQKDLAWSMELGGGGGATATEFSGVRVYATPGLLAGLKGISELLCVCAKPERSTGRVVSRCNSPATAGLRRQSTGGSALAPGGLRAKVTGAKGGGGHGGAHRALGRWKGCRREAGDEVAWRHSGSARAELEEETRWWISELLVPSG